MASLTLVPTKVPRGYFSDSVVSYIQKIVTEILSKDFINPIEVDSSSVRRVLQRVLDDRLEPLPKMLTRVIMEITNEIKTFELERTRNLRLESFFQNARIIYDVSARSGPDMQTIKLSRQPSTLRFYHTFGL
jgi:hypothetical protein